jgi:threonine/homoserine/homoserine lactone efflux protein
MLEVIVVMFIVLLVLFAYFLPTVMAEARGHQNSGMIFLANLLLGWTILGWIAALVWAATAVQTRRPGRRGPNALDHCFGEVAPEPKPEERNARR